MDYKNDCFRYPILYQQYENPVRTATSDIAEYIRWMENDYHIGDPSRTDRNNYSKEDWYFRRISWLHRLLDILEISPAQVVDMMKSMWTPETEMKYWTLDVQSSIKHFLLSWDVWGKRESSLVGEVETILNT